MALALLSLLMSASSIINTWILPASISLLAAVRVLLSHAAAAHVPK